MGTADAINKACKAARVSEHTRLQCHELHGKVRTAGGSDEDCMNAVRNLLAARTAPRVPPPVQRWDMPTFPDEDEKGAS